MTIRERQLKLQGAASKARGEKRRAETVNQAERTGESERELLKANCWECGHSYVQMHRAAKHWWVFLKM